MDLLKYKTIRDWVSEPIPKVSWPPTEEQFKEAYQRLAKENIPEESPS